MKFPVDNFLLDVVGETDDFNEGDVVFLVEVDIDDLGTWFKVMTKDGLISEGWAHERFVEHPTP